MSSVEDAKRFNLHGLSVHIENNCPALAAWLDRLCATFPGDALGGAIAAAVGTIRSFDAAEVLRNVSPEAALVGRVDDLGDVFARDERFWVVDDRWGICQINLLKHQWRAWILAHPSAATNRCIEGAVLWPLAQLLKARAMELIPARSIEKDGWSAIILCPWDLTQEMRQLESEGYQILGRDWSAAQTRDNRVQLLGMPSLSGQTATEAPITASECSAVFIVEPGRRATTRGRILGVSEACAMLRRAWPIMELPPNRRRPASAAALLARRCKCMAVQLSKCETDFVQLIESSRRGAMGMKKVTVAVSPAVRRASQAIRLNRPVTFQ